ncbi:translational activator of cytochrome c oxidase 1 [Microplitis demolitor]|uniref:translational activator of cytochrome c oxidase 1 n=1 Tax=Microplitis demolitor TaxID=69319 RepID=UPI0006D4CB8D|nr:translational activator of cytochrome c oxidase 1 [Microplitis demolitor]
MYNFTRACVQRTFREFIRQDKRLKGHSKWANIQHTKAEKDAEKSALSSAFSRRIKVVVAENNNITKPSDNPKLASIIDEARKKNIPQATINGILEKLEKSKVKSQTELLDFRGPGGTTFIVRLLSSNLIGTKQSLNTVLKKHKCTLLEGKSKGSLFDHFGCIITEHKNNLDAATEDAIAVGAEDVEEIEDDGKFYRFTCDPLRLPRVKNQLESLNYTVLTADEEFIPRATVQLSDDDLKRVDTLFVKLKVFEEVVSINHNIDLPDDDGEKEEVKKKNTR